MNKPHPIILGIETSCDETAAAVYQTERGVLSNVLFSQIDLHKQYGGVIPEVASRSHLEKINGIVLEAIDAACITPDEIDIVAVTSKPGLPGSLLVGVAFAKGFAWARAKKIIGINHLEGHAFSSFLDSTPPFPHLCLTASGGHTSLYLIEDYGKYSVLGQTRDDAAGEAFDKTAKLLHMEYPGGPIIERLAASMQFKDFFKYPRGNRDGLDFSFSGLKTAILYDLVNNHGYDMKTKQFAPSTNLEQLQKEVASSLLVCIGDIFEEKIRRAWQAHPQVTAVTFVGGVACNKYLKQRLQTVCTDNGRLFFAPPPRYCTDNAAMIAFVGSYKAQAHHFSDWHLDIL
jgi:N6-L-threonylcarbamoyladenine synthase